jgi:hypothetical protein
MERTINTICLDALKTLSIYSVDETAPSKYISELIELFGLIVDDLSSIGPTIPFFSTYSFTLAPNKSTYTIGLDASNDFVAPPITELETAFLINNNNKYMLRLLNYTQFDSMGMQVTLSAMPRSIVVERGDESSSILFYPIPDQPYGFSLRYKGRLSPEGNQQPVHSVPEVFHLFLTYHLARFAKDRFPTADWDDKREKTWETLYDKYISGNDIDMTVLTTNILSSGYGFYDINSIVRGF